jgi:hypothetical protein
MDSWENVYVVADAMCTRPVSSAMSLCREAFLPRGETDSSLRSVENAAGFEGSEYTFLDISNVVGFDTSPSDAVKPRVETVWKLSL